MLVSLMTWKGKCKRPNVQSNPAVKIFGNADDRTSARTSYPSSVNESKSFPYACKNSDENALTGPLYKGMCDLSCNLQKRKVSCFEITQRDLKYIPGKFRVKNR